MKQTQQILILYRMHLRKLHISVSWYPLLHIPENEVMASNGTKNNASIVDSS